MKSIDKILQTLIINGTLTVQPGLFYGKTGIAVFFFHYARHTGNSLFHEYAMELIEAIQKQITVTTSLRYDTGIAGIGAGFDYFLQNGFIETDDSDFFSAFDDRMYRAAMYEPYPDLSLSGGLTGWGRYFIYRLRGNKHKDSRLHEALTHIANEIAQCMEENRVTENEQPDVCRFFSDLASLPEHAKKYVKDSLPPAPSERGGGSNVLTEKIRQGWEIWNETDTSSLANMGLLNGWAAEGMLYLTFFHNLDKAWLNLL